MGILINLVVVLLVQDVTADMNSCKTAQGMQKCEAQFPDEVVDDTVLLQHAINVDRGLRRDSDGSLENTPPSDAAPSMKSSLMDRAEPGSEITEELEHSEELEVSLLQKPKWFPPPPPKCNGGYHWTSIEKTWVNVGQQMMTDKANDGKKCPFPGRNDRTFKTTGSRSAGPCMLKCQNDVDCVAFSMLPGSWCIGCNKPLSANARGARSFKRNITSVPSSGRFKIINKAYQDIMIKVFKGSDKAMTVTKGQCAYAQGLSRPLQCDILTGNVILMNSQAYERSPSEACGESTCKVTVFLKTDPEGPCRLAFLKPKASFIYEVQTKMKASYRRGWSR